MINLREPKIRNVCTFPFSRRNSLSPLSPDRKKVCPFRKSRILLPCSSARRQATGRPLKRSTEERAAYSSRLPDVLAIVLGMATILAQPHRRRRQDNVTQITQFRRNLRD